LPPPDPPPLARARAAVLTAAGQLGLDVTGLRPLHMLSNAVYLLPAADAVARVALTPGSAARVRRAIAVTRWLTSLDYPCVRPLDVDQPVVVGDDADGAVVSLWRYLPQPTDAGLPEPAALGRLLRDLHALPASPVGLPTVTPLARLSAAIEADTSALSGPDRDWLLARGDDLLNAYQQLDPPLGHGLVHGDAHLGNVLLDAARGRPVLADWDPVAYGPREWDLVLIAGDDRFGLPAADRAAFAAAYGYDVTTWPQWTILRDLRELHSLAAYIRLAPTVPAAAAELNHRIGSLRTGERHTVWHALD
jgi:aminoglycoside phosphotransferase (APT) family kinase protein